MAEIYEYDENIVNGLLLKALIFEEDISSKRFKSEFQDDMIDLLGYVLKNVNDIKHLDFNISNDDGYYKVTAHNILTALWFKGLFPIETKEVLMNNSFQFEDTVYRFDKQTNTFTYNTIKNDKNRND